MTSLTRSLTLAAILALTVTPAFAGNCGAMGAKQASNTSADIVETAVGAGSFTTLVAAVKAAGLVETLQSDGPFTVFAPTDEAFAKLPAGTVEALLADPDRLRQILLYHVVPGKVMAADVINLESATSAEGSAITITVGEGSVMVDNANLVTTDIETRNGVIHVIDSVILPAAG